MASTSGRLSATRNAPSELLLSLADKVTRLRCRVEEFPLELRSCALLAAGTCSPDREMWFFEIVLSLDDKLGQILDVGYVAAALKRAPIEMHLKFLDQVAPARHFFGTLTIKRKRQAAVRSTIPFKGVGHSETGRL
jgi:hypothetical protein